MSDSGSRECRTVITAVVVWLTAGALPAASGAPVAVSPGSAEEVALIAESCPTFSWAGVARAAGYELVVYRLEVGPDGRQLVVSDEEEPLLWVELPGAAGSWTPELGDCFEVEGAYAWAVRATGVAEEAWSEAALFEVVSAAALSEVEAAVERLVERRLDALGLDAGELPAGLVGEVRVGAGGEARLVPKATAGGATALGPGLLATTAEDPLELHVAGSRAARYEPAKVPGSGATAGEFRPNVVAGSDFNQVRDGVFGATIGGGGGHGFDVTNIDTAWPNRVSGDFGTVGGGLDNRAGNESPSNNSRFATVTGGWSNLASGTESTVGGGLGNAAIGSRSTVGGGSSNTASGHSSSVGGGRLNTASGASSSVGGGSFNTATGSNSTVPGGTANDAAGNYSFAAGRRAKAQHDGAFVWADSQNANFESTNTNQFRVRAANGAFFHVSAMGVFGDHTVTGNLNVIGTKNFVQPHPEDPELEIRYTAAEAGEAGVYWRGAARTEGGEAVVELPEHFRLVTGEEGLTAHLTPRGGWAPLFVRELTPGRLVVGVAEGLAGSDVAFDFLVRGVRRGYEEKRAVVPNEHFRPGAAESPEAFEERMARHPRVQALLVENGLLAADGSADPETVARLRREAKPHDR